MKKIGIIESGGTGKELAEIFKVSVEYLCNKADVPPLEFVSFEENYKYKPGTFWEIHKKFSKKSYVSLLKVISKEVRDINFFIKLASKKKVLGIFRTAINAETLYHLRIKSKIVKAVFVKIKDRELLFVRDQIQGFYSNDNVISNRNQLKVNASFSLKNFNTILSFVQNKFLSKNYQPDIVLFIYKYHIFGLELERMIMSAVNKNIPKINIKIMQPDSGIHYLLNDWWNYEDKKILVICGNEVGDMLLESLIHFYKLGTKESVFTNEYSLDNSNIEILQTMHGSADSLTGNDSVNPTATLKAVAYALENWLSIPNAVKRMDVTLSKTKFKGSTTNMVKEVLKSW